MPTQRPCLPPPCPGSKMLAGSTIFFNFYMREREIRMDKSIHLCKTALLEKTLYRAYSNKVIPIDSETMPTLSLMRLFSIDENLILL